MERHELTVEVKYSAAAHPYKQEGAPQSETVGQLLTRVLEAFHITPAGGTVYNLRYEGKVLENLAETLGQLAGHKQHLLLTLGHQLVSG